MAKKKKAASTGKIKIPQSGFISIDGERYYKIADSSKMRPFFMNIISDSDLWLFVTSNGGLTAGRINANKPIFPYVTTDKLSDSVGITGPITVIRITGPSSSKKNILWQPFLPFYDGQFSIIRNIYKNITGNKVLFEEINSDLGLSFRYSWTSCEKFGLVRTARLENISSKPVNLEIIDGVRNILPAGINSAIQSESSTLADAYKWSEKISNTALAIYIMNSALTDKAEPRESFKATTVWSTGLSGDLLLSDRQLEDFRRGAGVATEKNIKGTRGAYLLRSLIKLKPGGHSEWHMILDTDLSQTQVADLRDLITGKEDMSETLDTACAEASLNLEKIMSAADALQISGRETATVHHFANVLFNCMRGGVVLNGYGIDKNDFKKFISVRNKKCVQNQSGWLDVLPAVIERDALIESAMATGDQDLVRLTLEYLPLAFSRRHGDPSRPWNKFNIRVKNNDGTMALNYEGNWRDIFQNWESLFFSFPSYFENSIAKFVNAMTVDGYNPYRISRDGIDWEKINHEDPWAFIGYWGDHQVIYLLKLLEWMDKFFPGRLAAMLTQSSFSYANIPYRLRPYAEIVKDPHNTIIFDEKLDQEIDELVKKIGSDGRLLLDKEGNVRHFTLAEKLLMILLAKMVNFVPGGGIWMNTQRPEWNDANNALAGYGISMVTLQYLRRYAAFLLARTAPFKISGNILSLLRSIQQILETSSGDMKKTCENNTLRRRVMDELGKTGEAYRTAAYAGNLGDPEEISVQELKEFLTTCIEWMDTTIANNRRDDDLFHSYNLIHLENGSARITQLDPMLEGQVAAIASGALSPEKVNTLLASLKRSPLYRKDQLSYLLYPAKEHPKYLDRNRIPPEDVARSALIRKALQQDGKGLVTRDLDGTVRFFAGAQNGKELDRILDKLATRTEFTKLVESERFLILEIYEKVFNHHSFTGRSGSMFSYEGIGCIYWHMVAKLLLAAEENCLNTTGKERDRLKSAAHEISLGLGYNKTPEIYGAFPTDPYSHTPSHSGAQQPGMTGQVKEEILTRWLELGLIIEAGCIKFNPYLLDKSEFAQSSQEFYYYGMGGIKQVIKLEKNEFAFTFCQVPVIFRAGDKSGILVQMTDGTTRDFPDKSLDSATSLEIFRRTGKVKEIRVSIKI